MATPAPALCDTCKKLSLDVIFVRSGTIMVPDFIICKPCDEAWEAKRKREGTA